MIRDEDLQYMATGGLPVALQVAEYPLINALRSGEIDPYSLSEAQLDQLGREERDEAEGIKASAFVSRFIRSATPLSGLFIDETPEEKADVYSSWLERTLPVLGGYARNPGTYLGGAVGSLAPRIISQSKLLRPLLVAGEGALSGLAAEGTPETAAEFGAFGLGGHFILRGLAKTGIGRKIFKNTAALYGVSPKDIPYGMMTQDKYLALRDRWLAGIAARKPSLRALGKTKEIYPERAPVDRTSYTPPRPTKPRMNKVLGTPVDYMENEIIRVMRLGEDATEKEVGLAVKYLSKLPEDRRMALSLQDPAAMIRFGDISRRVSSAASGRRLLNRKIIRDMGFQESAEPEREIYEYLTGQRVGDTIKQRKRVGVKKQPAKAVETETVIKQEVTNDLFNDYGGGTYDRPTAEADIGRVTDAMRPATSMRPGGKSELMVLKESGAEPMPMEYNLIEASELQPSHDPFTFEPNANYPRTVQPRDYKSVKGEQDKVIENARRFDPRFLINDTPGTVDGPPVVDQYGIVLGGNGRTMSLKRVYREGGGAYKEHLKKNADRYGFTPDQVDAMQEPVLVRKIDAEPKDYQRIARDLNKDPQQSLAPAERSRALADVINDRDVFELGNMAEDETIKEFLDSPRSDEFIRRLQASGIFSRMNWDEYFSGDKLNSAGKELIQDALLGRVILDNRVLRAIPKQFLQKIELSSGNIIRAGIAGDKMLPEMLTKIGARRAQGGYGQEILGGSIELNPREDALYKFIDTHTPKEVRSAFGTYAEYMNRLFGEGGSTVDMFDPMYGVDTPAALYDKIFNVAQDVAPKAPKKKSLPSGEKLKKKGSK